MASLAARDGSEEQQQANRARAELMAGASAKDLLMLAQMYNQSAGQHGVSYQFEQLQIEQREAQHLLRQSAAMNSSRVVFNKPVK